MKKQWVTYILECADGTLYAGATNNIDGRLEAHNAGKGSKYVRARRPARVVYIALARSKSAACSRETAIKRLSRIEKLALIKAQKPRTKRGSGDSHSRHAGRRQR